MKKTAVVASVAGLCLLGYLGTARHYQRTNPQPSLDGDASVAFTPAWPVGFMWGTATAAHQVEGGNTHNDWYRFEHEKGTIAHGDTSGLTTDHWNRVAEDVALMKDLGANAYRFSIEWSRVEPVEGTWDQAAWAHYANEVMQLRAAGIQPMVTLLHFTLPQWMADRGGVTAPDFPEKFGRFAAEAVRWLGPQVIYWCTVNEPQVQMYNGYVTGYWPPRIKDNAKATQAFVGLLRGHAAAAVAIRKGSPVAQIGAASNMIWFEPANRWNVLEWYVSQTVAEGFNWAFYESIKNGRMQLHLPGFPTVDEDAPSLKGTVDWIGINYYRRNLVRFKPGAPGMVDISAGPGELSDAKVELYPAGLLALIREGWKRYRLPIMITEYGVADSTGAHRPRFQREHAYAIAQAIREGADVRGAFHWSLTDNFEWAEGYGWRFGLYRLDLKTLVRSPAPGSEEFTRLAPASSSDIGAILRR